MRDYAQKEAMPAAPRPLTDAEVETIAEVVHEANRVWQRANGEEPSPPFAEAPEWQKASARNGIRATLEGRKTPSFKSEEEESHNGWMEEKLRAGWTYGEVKDAEKKTHPCLLPYASLPDWQRRKDHLFRAIVLALDPRRYV